MSAIIETRTKTTEIKDKARREEKQMDDQEEEVEGRKEEGTQNKVKGQI